jgi:hypothetical protein
MSVVKRESGKANGTDSSLISSPHRLSIYKTSQGADFPVPDRTRLSDHETLVLALEPLLCEIEERFLPPALAASVLLTLPFAPHRILLLRVSIRTIRRTLRGQDKCLQCTVPFGVRLLCSQVWHSSPRPSLETFSPLSPPRTSADGVKLGEHFGRNS